MKTQEEFAFEIWSMSIEKLAADKWIDGIDVNQIDAFLSSGKWDDDSRAKLLADREAAFAAYQQDKLDRALLKMNALNQTCLRLGFKQAARPLLRAAANSRKGATTGRDKGIVTKKQAAAEWQTRILNTVIRLLNAGKTDSDIAGRTNKAAGQSIETIRKFVAKVRKSRREK